MAEVPLSPARLEEIALAVAIDLVEQWAIDDRIPGDDDEIINLFKQYAVEDTVFVINDYMEKFNEAVQKAQQEESIKQLMNNNSSIIV